MSQEDCKAKLDELTAEYLGLSEIANHDIQIYDYRSDLESVRYYEITINYGILESQMVSTYRYDTFDEIREMPSCLACGGTAFILFRVCDHQREVVAQNLPFHENNGWIDEGKLVWETQEQDRKSLLKKLAEEAQQRHPEYKHYQDLVEEVKCDRLIARIRFNLTNR